MAHVILGLLMLAPMSLYDLLRAFESGVSLFYSASSGSLKRALDGLLARGEVEVEETGDGRGRKVYRVTDAGRAAFRVWMTGELTGSLETAALSRAFFLGLLEPDERVAVVAQVERRVADDLAQLERLEAQVSQQEVPDGLADVARYQRAVLDYGLGTHRLALRWVQESLPRT